jgi:hypothetical protein
VAAFHTHATRRALVASARLLGIFGGDSAADTIGRGIDLVPPAGEELERWAKLTSVLGAEFAQSGILPVTTAKGNRHTCEVGQLEVRTIHGQSLPIAGQIHTLRSRHRGGSAEPRNC